MDEVAGGEGGDGEPAWGASGFWADAFPPPPPRPAHLAGAAPDGITTCDLCAWARADSPAYPRSEGGGTGWILTLMIVSIVSAAVGAVIMVTVLRCRRKIRSRPSGTGSTVGSSRAVAAESGGRGTEDSGRPKGCSPAATENHYTHLEGTREAAYASLGRAPYGSIPSSAYYSELSAGELAYEAVGLAEPQLPVPNVPTASASDYV